MNPNADWFRDQKWGIFTHYLSHEQNKPGTITNMNVGRLDWNVHVEALDVNLIAQQLREIGARYLMFTVMQGQRFLCAPNATYDNICGFKPGEACCERDLIADLIGALDKYGIALFLYYTGDGPHFDPIAGPAMGYAVQEGPLTDNFLQNWSDVGREYSMRYGEKVKGWWVDGCYEFFHYTPEKHAILGRGLKAGNPHALMAYNGGVMKRVEAFSSEDDYTCGEMNDFVDLPDQRFLNGAQWHTLAPLGIAPDGSEWGSWCKPGCKRGAEYMMDYVGKVNERQGIVTIDIALYRDGHFDPEQMALLRHLRGM